jgi:amino acid transporter
LTSQASSPDSTLIRGIGRWDFVALFINSIVGAGIFGLPSRVDALIGPYSILAYLLCAVLVLLIIWCFAEAGSRFTGTGGPYLYATEAFGPTVGFQIGWLMWLSRVASFAALSNLFIDYIGHFWPDAAMPAPRAVLLTSITMLFAVINVTGVRNGALLADLFTIGKIVPLILFVAAGLFFVQPANFAVADVHVDYTSFSAAVFLLVFAFTGFEAAVIPGGEIKDPQRTLPFGAMVAFAIIAPLYILIQIVCTGTLPGLDQSERPLADSASSFLGSAGGALMAATALVSIAGTLNGLMLAAPRILFAMSERGQLPSALSQPQPRFRTPHIAIVATAAVMLAFTLAGSFVGLVAIATLARLTTFAATCAAVPKLRRMHPDQPAAFVVPGGMISVVFALLLIAWLLTSSSLQETITVSVVLLVGLAIQFAMQRR